MDVSTRSTPPRGEPARGGNYVFAPAQREEQYRCLSEAFHATTTARLAEIGVGDGWRCLDVGCGNGALSRWLADRVAPTGQVLATDVDPIAVADRPNLTVVKHDVRTDPVREESLDLIVVRLLLQHFPDRDAVLAKLARALKPGGWLQVEEFDTSYGPVFAASTEGERLFERFLSAKRALMRSKGGNPEWGREAARSLQDVGLVDVNPVPFVATRHAGSPDLALQLNHTHHLREGLLEMGMTDEELEKVRDVMLNPSFRASASPLISVQGRKRS